jgi:hypothetical protein
VHQTVKQLAQLAPLLVGISLLVGVLIFFKLDNATIHNELVTLDLIPKPETLTELYFKNNVNLPDSTKSNQVIRFAFVIHNLEATDYQYTYNVYVNTNSTKHIVDSGRVLVKDNQNYVKNERFKLIKSQGNQEIVVELVNKNQSIDFRPGK